MPGIFRTRTSESGPQQASGRELLLDGEILARWYMEMRFEEEVERSHRYGRPLSVLVAKPALLPGEAPARKAVFAAAGAARSQRRHCVSIVPAIPSGAAMTASSRPAP